MESFLDVHLPLQYIFTFVILAENIISKLNKTEVVMKKNVFYICSLITVLLISVSHAEAGLYDLHIEWSYDDSGPRALQSFILYRNGTKVLTDIGSNYRVLDCILDIPEHEVTSNFTLTAVDTENYEGPHSAPYTFTADYPITPSAVQGFQIGTYKQQGPKPYFFQTPITNVIKEFQPTTYAQGATQSLQYFFEKDSVFATTVPIIVSYKSTISSTIFPSFSQKQIATPLNPMLTKLALIIIKKPRIKNT